MPTPDEVTELVLASMRGAPVQLQALDEDPDIDPWVDRAPAVPFAWDLFRYRLKPATARRVFVWFDAAGKVKFAHNQRVATPDDAYGPFEFVEAL